MQPARYKKRNELSTSFRRFGSNSNEASMVAQSHLSLFISVIMLSCIIPPPSPTLFKPPYLAPYPTPTKDFRNVSKTPGFHGVQLFSQIPLCQVGRTVRSLARERRNDRD